MLTTTKRCHLGTLLAGLVLSLGITAPAQAADFPTTKVEQVTLPSYNTGLKGTVVELAQVAGKTVCDRGAKRKPVRDGFIGTNTVLGQLTWVQLDGSSTICRKKQSPSGWVIAKGNARRSPWQASPTGRLRGKLTLVNSFDSFGRTISLTASVAATSTCEGYDPQPTTLSVPVSATIDTDLLAQSNGSARLLKAFLTGELKDQAANGAKQQMAASQTPCAEPPYEYRRPKQVEKPIVQCALQFASYEPTIPVNGQRTIVCETRDPESFPRDFVEAKNTATWSSNEVRVSRAIPYSYGIDGNVCDWNSSCWTIAVQGYAIGTAMVGFAAWIDDVEASTEVKIPVVEPIVTTYPPTMK